MVTINDIARRAGVAKSTVSRYLNGGSVSKKTRLKLDEIVAETGFTPNTFAQSLKAKKTNMIGTIIPRLDSFSTNEVLMTIDEELRQRSQQLLITNSSQDTRREIENIYTLAKQKVDGILFFAGALTPQHVEAIQSVDLPVVVLGQQLPEAHCIIYNEDEAGYTMGRHIAALGHRRILILSVTEADTAIGQHRTAGILRAWDKTPAIQYSIRRTSFVFEAAYQEALAILPETEASAIICLTDTIALAVMKAAHELGIAIPEELSLSGFGGYAPATIVTPAITTLRYPYREAGTLAVRSLLSILEKEEVPLLQQLDARLVETASAVPFKER